MRRRVRGLRINRVQPRRIKEDSSRQIRRFSSGISQSATRLSPQTPYAVGFLVLANIFAYLAFDVRGDLFSDPGAFSVGSVRGGEWGRLITYQFLHTGILELLFSVLLMVVFAILIEQRYGHVAALCIYLFAGIGGGLIALLFNIDGVIAGSLVSTLGLMGAWLVAISRPQTLDHSYPLVAGILIVAVLFLYGFVQEGVNVWAEAGGLLTGALVALSVELARVRR